MRGQVTIEFIVTFGICIASILVLAGFLLSQKVAVDKASTGLSKLADAEPLIRAVEIASMHNMEIRKWHGGGDVEYRIENGHAYITIGSKVIETKIITTGGKDEPL